MIIDVHVHYQARDGYLAELVEACAREGIDKVCMNGGGPDWKQRGNDEVLKAAERYPDLIVPFAFVGLGTARAADIDAFVRAGFRGLKTQNPLAPYDSPEYWPLYEKAQKHRLPWLLHTGITARYPGEKDGKTPYPKPPNVSSDRMRPVRLDAVARDFPGLTLVAAHLGYPWFAEAAAMALVHPNLFFDLAGVDLSDKLYPSLLVFRDLFWGGPKHWAHLVFGTEGGPSDYDWRTREHWDLLARHDVPRDVQQQIMGGNLARALGIV